MPEYKLSATLTHTDVEDVKQAIQTIKQKLPFLLSLNGDERRALALPGDRGQAFITKALEVATQNPEILPGFFDREEMRRDLELTQSLQRIPLAFDRS